MTARVLAVRTAGLRSLRRLWRPWKRFRARQVVARQGAFADRLLRHLADGEALFGGVPARVSGAQLTRSAVMIARAAPPGAGESAVLVKVALTPEAARSLERHRLALEALLARPSLGPLHALLARPLAWGMREGRAYYVETLLPGVAASDLVSDPAASRAAQQVAARAILGLHAETARMSPVDEGRYARLVGDDLALLGGLVSGWPEPAALRAALGTLGAHLARRLRGGSLPLGWAHGDFWAGNALVCRPGGPLSGIIDWDRAAPDDLPLQDLLHLLVYGRKVARGSELGEEVAALLAGGHWARHEQELLDEGLACLGLPSLVAAGDLVGDAIRMYWLRQIAANLRRYPGRRRDRRWLAKNVFLVLRQEPR